MKPCTCWIAISLHDGHCCFAELTIDGLLTCDHYDAGMALMEASE